MNRFALVTGTSSGIGLAIVNYLLDEGYMVFAVSRSGTPIDHGHIIDINADIRKEEEVESLYDYIAQTTSELDLVVNNAAFCNIDPIHETSTKDFKTHLETNILGVFHVLKHLRSFIELICMDR